MLHSAFAAAFLLAPLAFPEARDVVTKLVMVDLPPAAPDETPSHEPQSVAPEPPPFAAPPSLTFRARTPPGGNAITLTQPSLPTHNSATGPDTVKRYAARVSAQLAAVKRYPWKARITHIEGIVVLRLTVDRKGHVLNARIATSAQAEPLDQEALAMVRRAAPFPPLPPAIEGASLDILVPIHFSLHES